MKKCSKCKEHKQESNFHKDKSRPSGYANNCKSCDNLRQRDEKGLISRIYRSQKATSKNRGHVPPCYSRDELSDWLYLNDYKKLHSNWVGSGYEKELKPSVDRIDDYRGYSLENIQLLTWGENSKKAYNQRRNAVGLSGDSVCKSVDQFSLSGNFIKSHKSIAIAARETNCSSRGISKACCGHKDSSDGFKWRHSK